jgi:hypothetical protein
MEINLRTTEKRENFWHCWICGAKGKTLLSLFRKIKAPQGKINELNILVIPDNTKSIELSAIQLPKEFISLINTTKLDKILQIELKHVLKFLKSCGLTQDDIIKYNIGFCKDGKYGGRVIIPSYDDNKKLNYFIARDYKGETLQKYKNPPVAAKDVIGFELYINWDAPIILVEGMIEQQGKIDHIIEVDILNIAVIKNKNLLADFNKISDINIHVDINVLMLDDINPRFRIINSGATLDAKAAVLSKGNKLHNGATALHKRTALGEKLHDIINLASENLGTRLILEEHLHTLAVESSSRCMRATHSGKAALKLDHDLLIEGEHQDITSHSGNTLNSGGGLTRTSLGINNGVAIAVLDPVENVDLIIARGHNMVESGVICKLPSLAGIILV